MLVAFLSGLLYPAPGIPVPSPPPAPLEEVHLELSTGAEAVAWLGVPPDAPGPVALFFHGNGENLETMRRARLFEELRELGVIALAVDYPGYGRSPGKPDEQGVLATGPAALAWAEERYPDRPVVLCGWSLGAAVAIRTAAGAGDRVDGLVALSPWTSLEDTVRSHAPDWFADRFGGWLFGKGYDSLAAARSIRLPALVAHGEDDRVIPVEHGERIAEALREAGSDVRWVRLTGTGHNDLLARPRVWSELARLLGRSRDPSRDPSRAGGGNPGF